jgi:hypothetical protein
VLVELAKDEQNLRQEGRDHVPPLGRVGSQRLEKGMFESRDLEFDVEESGGVVAGENQVEGGKVCKFAGACVRNLNFADVWVVADERASIGSAAHVELEAITAVGESEVKGRERVFGDDEGGSGTAMAQQKHVGILAEGRRHHANSSRRLWE